jgi:uncharacterized protein (DUF2235 family)
MPKNIVICCDGTGNEFNPQSNSNVVKLCSTLVINQDQVSYYHPGVGTMGSPTANSWLAKEWSRVVGLAFGGGFFEDIGRAYQYLMYNYNEYSLDGKADHDHVYLFGFSRGAYTARALASLLKMFGLLHPGNEAQIPYVLRMFESRHNENFRALMDEAKQFKEIFSRPCFIHFAGLWDTVSSVGWVTQPVRLPYTARNPIIANVRHAQSIDERRIFFRQNSFTRVFKGDDLGDGTPSPITQDFKQVWFAGVHSDVGGSYAPDRSGLSQIALEWLLVEAESRGLLLHPDKVRRVLSYADPRYAPDPAADLNVSLRGAWWILEFLPHKTYNYKTGGYNWSVPMGSPRTLPDDLRIHETVRVRWDNRKDYRPKNLLALPPNDTDEPWVKYGANHVADIRSADDDRAAS